jgi:hypothetical protein
VALDRRGLLFGGSRTPAPDEYATTNQVKEFDAQRSTTPDCIKV